MCSKEVTTIAVTKNHPFSAIEKALENNIFKGKAKIFNGELKLLETLNNNPEPAGIVAPVSAQDLGGFRCKDFAGFTCAIDRLRK